MAHPDRRIEFLSRGDSRGVWDRDRVAQLVSNLVGNAIRHGRDPRSVSMLTRTKVSSSCASPNAVRVSLPRSFPHCSSRTVEELAPTTRAWGSGCLSSRRSCEPMAEQSRFIPTMKRPSSPYGCHDSAIEEALVRRETHRRTLAASRRGTSIPGFARDGTDHQGVP